MLDRSQSLLEFTHHREGAVRFYKEAPTWHRKNIRDFLPSSFNPITHEVGRKEPTHRRNSELDFVDKGKGRSPITHHAPGNLTNDMRLKADSAE